MIRIWGFHKLDEIGNDANIGIRDFTAWEQKIPVIKYYPKWVLNHWPRIQSPACSPYPNWVLICEAKLLESLYSHALLILTKCIQIQKVVNEHKFKT